MVEPVRVTGFVTRVSDVTRWLESYAKVVILPRGSTIFVRFPEASYVYVVTPFAGSV